jgi:hypothetical protein
MSLFPSISFYVTCKNRNFHNRYTLPYNLKRCEDVLQPLGVAYEFVLMNYNSQDNLHEFVMTYHAKDIASRHLVYAHSKEPPYFYAAHAKNCAARLCQYDILVNIDCDNFLSVFYLYALLSWKPGTMLYVPYFNGEVFEGVRGRIAMEKSLFYQMQGYEEHLTKAYGYEDDDLVYRALAMGVPGREIHPLVIGKVIGHHDELRYCFMEKPEINWQLGKQVSDSNIELKQYVANQNRPWGALPDLSIASVESSSV